MKWTGLESVTKPLSLLELLATFTFANDKDVENEARASTRNLKVQRQKNSKQTRKKSYVNQSQSVSLFCLKLSDDIWL